MNILYNNSPRSKSAIELLGIEESNLYYVSYDEFIKSHPELIFYILIFNETFI